jgi:hypothetical protein
VQCPQNAAKSRISAAFSICIRLYFALHAGHSKLDFRGSAIGQNNALFGLARKPYLGLLYSDRSTTSSQRPVRIRIPARTEVERLSHADGDLRLTEKPEIQPLTLQYALRSAA